MEPEKPNPDYVLENLLDRGQYDILCLHFKDFKAKENAPQTIKHHFFDTSDLALLKQGITLRADEKETGEWKLVFKPISTSDRPRVEQDPLYPDQKVQLFDESIVPAGPLRVAVHRFSALPLVNHGEGTTKRIVLERGKGRFAILLEQTKCFDKTNYRIKLAVRQNGDATADNCKEIAKRYFNDLLDNFEIMHVLPKSKTDQFFYEMAAAG